MPETPSSPRSIDETVLMRLEPIAALSPERVRELAALCYPETVPAGGTLFREGERDGRAVFLLRGEVRLSSAVAGLNRTVRAGTPETRAPLPGEALPSSEARHALADKQPRQATAVAETDVEVLPIDGELLEIMLTWDQLLASQARMHAARRVDGPEQSMAVILQSLAFRNLPPARIDQLAARLERTLVEAGQVLIREGEEGDYYYLIERGTAEVARAAPGGGRSPLAMLGRGGAFGEEALASGARRNATVTMKTDGVLWRLAKQDFVELLRAPLLNWVSREQAAARVRSDRARWLDVRHPAEYAFARVPGALLCPLQDLRSLAKDLDQGFEYICYCKTGRRSSAAAFLLSQLGFRACVLKDGLQALPAGAEE